MLELTVQKVLAALPALFEKRVPGDSATFTLYWSGEKFLLCSTNAVPAGVLRVCRLCDEKIQIGFTACEWRHIESSIASALEQIKKCPQPKQCYLPLNVKKS